MGRRRQGVMSEGLKYELAKDLGFYDVVQKEGWEGIRAKDAGNMVKRAIQIAQEHLVKQHAAERGASAFARQGQTVGAGAVQTGGYSSPAAAGNYGRAGHAVPVGAPPVTAQPVYRAPWQETAPMQTPAFGQPYSAPQHQAAPAWQQAHAQTYSQGPGTVTAPATAGYGTDQPVSYSAPQPAYGTAPTTPAYGSVMPSVYGLNRGTAPTNAGTSYGTAKWSMKPPVEQAGAGQQSSQGAFGSFPFGSFAPSGFAAGQGQQQITTIQ